ncbi:MAG: hypothetical protein U5K00_21260 [Melioribacteraceae bacterium]|nr:hypothetical protein [Melioribacteraceae bacterium]
MAFLEYDYVDTIAKKLMHSSSLQKDKGLKIINFSEVPSDVLPLMVSLVARIIFSIQQWIEKENRHPLAIFCDEAHLYLPEKTKSTIESTGLENFERIAKEGRKIWPQSSCYQSKTRRSKPYNIKSE